MLKEQTYTLAAIFQTAKLVQDIARSGQNQQASCDVLLNSLVITSPEQTIDVYGGSVENLRLGLTALKEQLGDKSKAKDPELTRYIVSLLALERKMSKKPNVLQQLGERIDATKRQTSHYDINSETLLASFASIYSDVISPLGARIQVAGQPEILKQTHNQHRIRALLLAGIRNAVLWRQVGGKRRHVIFQRAKIMACADELLKHV